MQLNFQRYSETGPPLLVLHGLFGSLSNWGNISRQLATDFQVIGVDLRNHGASPHTEEMNYPAMASDVEQLLDQLGLQHCKLLGHSMGGKVAMELALSRPQLVDSLVVIDISPVAYAGGGDGHRGIIDAMESLSLGDIKNRNEADRLLAPGIEDNVVRQFILTNLARNPEGGYRWRLNLAAIKGHYGKLREQPVAAGPYEGPVLFIRGANSDYIQDSHQEQIHKLFPNAQMKTVMDAGHWVHAEQPEVLLNLVREFLVSH